MLGRLPLRFKRCRFLCLRCISLIWTFRCLWWELLPSLTQTLTPAFRGWVAGSLFTCFVSWQNFGESSGRRLIFWDIMLWGREAFVSAPLLFGRSVVTSYFPPGEQGGFSLFSPPEGGTDSAQFPSGDSGASAWLWENLGEQVAVHAQLLVSLSHSLQHFLTYALLTSMLSHGLTFSSETWDKPSPF